MRQAELDKHVTTLTVLWDLGFNTIGKLQIIVDILLEMQDSLEELKDLSDDERMKISIALKKLINADTGEKILPRPPFKIKSISKKLTAIIAN